MKTVLKYILRSVASLLFILPLLSFSQQVVRIEYFIDQDPGFGLATPLPVTPGDSLSETFHVDLSGLRGGMHFFCVRAMDSAGNWGLTNSFIFISKLGTDTLPDLHQAEYWIDNDPGFKQATPLTLLQGNLNDSIEVNIPLSGLDNGFHHLGVRVRDEFRNWSHTNLKVIYKGKVEENIQKLVEHEYFFDTDPGFGNGIPLAISPPVKEDSLSHYIDVSAISNGFHYLYFRTRDSLGAWSHTNYRTIWKGEVAENVQKLTMHEYFFDADPGFGNGTLLVVSPPKLKDSISMFVDLSSLADGVHFMYFRSRDSIGRWGHTNIKPIIKQGNTITQLSSLGYVEYFFGNDPGFGNAAGFHAGPGLNLDSLRFYVDESCLFDGQLALLYVRVKDESGRWSHTNIDTLIKRPLELIQEGPLQACAGDSVKLSATSAIGLYYTWLKDGTPLPYEHDSVMYAHQSGQYQVLVSNDQWCGDTSTATQVIIYAYPPEPTVLSPVEYCLGAAASPLMASGTDLLWYPTPAGGTGNSSAPTPSTSVADTFYYYVSQSTWQCEGDRAEIQVIVRPVPTASVSGTATVCQNSNPPQLTFANPMEIPVTIQYNINGGSAQTVNVAPGAAALVSAPTSVADTFVYTLTGVMYQSAPSCFNAISGSATVIVRSTPDASISGSTAVCVDDASPQIIITNLMSDPVTVYYSFNGGATQFEDLNANASSTLSVPTNATGTFVYQLTSVIYQGSPFCEDSLNDSAVVTVYAHPSTPVISMVNDTLFSSAPSGNQWYNSSGPVSGQTNSYYVPAVNDGYYVIVVLNGCPSDTSNIISTEISVPENSHSSSFSIYPNPFNENITVGYPVTERYHAALFNVKGQMIHDFGYLHGGAPHTLHIGEISAGVYMLRLTGIQECAFFKLLKE